MHQWLNRIWYSDRNIGWLLLLPFSGLYTLLSWLHRSPWRAGILRPETLPVPLIVVGNIPAGGAGKTPLVMRPAARRQANVMGWSLAIQVAPSER